jgi:hypothetical protein
MLKLTSTLLAALVLFAGSAPLSVNAQTSDDKTALKKSFEEKSFDIAERYFRRGKWRNAVDGYEKALPSYNQDSGIFYRLVVACSELGEARKTVLYGAGFNYLAPAHEFTDRLNAMVQKAKESLARAKVEPAVLTFEIAPKSTEITINYVPVGESFRDKIKLYPGTYTIRGTYYGHHEFKKVVEVTNRPIVLKAKLTKVITHGMLVIKTEPAAGITVYVDRKKVGVTPLKPMKLRSGRHYIRFELEGFDRWHRYVEIENDGTHPLNPVMERTPPGKSPFRME